MSILSLRVQVPNNHILTQNLYYNYYYPKPKYPIIGYMDPLGLNVGPELAEVEGRWVFLWQAYVCKREIRIKASEAVKRIWALEEFLGALKVPS